MDTPRAPVKQKRFVRRMRISIYRAKKHAKRAYRMGYSYVYPYTKRTYFPWIVGVLIILMLLSLWRCAVRPAKAPHKVVAVPVVLAPVQKRDVPVSITALGAVTPISTITVKTQINGQLSKVLFQEGQEVKIGELLAEIDPRPYEAQLVQFEGELIRDKALLANAHVDLKRYETLYKQDSVSQQILDTQRSLVQQLEGTVQFDQGQIETVKVNLIYCRIISPINGRVGLRLVDPGNFVQTTDLTGLFVLNTHQPITVIFSIPEDNIPAVMQQIKAGHTLVVESYDRTQNNLLATGCLLTVDNQIDPTTGTVKLKAEFSNEANNLFPNQFVNVRLLVTTLPNATVIPNAAIQRGSQGSFIFLVNNNQTVSVKPVSVQVVSGDNSAITATSEVSPGQSVVIQGADKLSEGTLITTTPNAHSHKRSTS